VFKTPLGWLRAVALTEGVSFLVLLCIAMPLKYIGNIPEAVAVTGQIHGWLFVLYVIMVFALWRTLNWSYQKLAVALIAAVVPLGTFVFEAHLRREARLAS
jgi:integral membrane protein